jgi:hypothetical protein
MKQVMAVAFAFGLVAAPAAFAADHKAPQQKPQPEAMKMSDAQLDNVSAGALINAVVVDVVDINNNQVAVAVPVNAAAAVNVLGGATGAAALQQPGNINQPR